MRGDDERVGGKAPALRACLLDWYSSARRTLPWRAVRDPYAVWVSEIMLQQTQVRTVIPYFERFMRRFPTVEALAAASEEEVLAAWKGLGYYTRARNLHRGAREVARLFGGRLPQDVKTLQRIPGIGRYTAGAIASIAFDQPVPVLDGNVVRVLCRLFAVEEPPNRPEVNRMLWRWASRLVPEKAPGTFNQALMELGALICTSGRPDCASCPLKTHCAAAERGDPGTLPARVERPARPDITAVCLVIRHPATGSVLFGRRPSRRLLGGLWELPTGSLREGETPVEAARRVGMARFGEDLDPGMRPEVVTQVFTHLRLVLHTAVCRKTPGPEGLEVLSASRPPFVPPVDPLGSGGFDVDYETYRWVAPEGMRDLPVGRATGEVLGHLNQESLW